MVEIYVGIDVSKAGWDVVVLKAEKRESQPFTNAITGLGKLNGWLSAAWRGGEHSYLPESDGPLQ